METEERKSTRAGDDVQGHVDQLQMELTAARAKIGHLETALHTSRHIAAAVGVLMASQKVTYDDAFQLLVAASQGTQLKVREVAEQVLLTGELPGAD